MSRETEAIEDIQRLLAMTWRTWGNEPLDPNSITRTWSLDLGWLSPQDSENLLTKLISKGWLESSDSGLSPKSDFSQINVPLGWFPRQRLIEEPPKFSMEIEKVQSDKSPRGDNHENKLDFDEIKETPLEISKNTNNENKSFDVISLLQTISKDSKLSKKVIMERAQKKRKTLGHVTIWMALFLVARELDIDVNDLQIE